jgi:ABC-type sugar transport system permease subunit
MQHLITFITVVGGLLLSLAVAIVVEEFIFGQIFRLFFAAPRPSAVRPVLVSLTADSHQ